MMEHTDKYVAGKKQVCGKCWEITELPELQEMMLDLEDTARLAQYTRVSTCLNTRGQPDNVNNTKYHM